MFIGGSIDEKLGGVEELLLERVRDAEEENNLGLGWNGQDGCYGFDGRIGKLEGVGEGDEFVMVADVFGDTRVVAA